LIISVKRTGFIKETHRQPSEQVFHTLSAAGDKRHGEDANNMELHGWKYR
jgi:hypothetical protein